MISNTWERFNDLSNTDFRDVRELLIKYYFEKAFDEVIFLSADKIGLDRATISKLEFYIDKLAKSAAAKARNRTVAVVTFGLLGISSLLPKLVKTYTGVDFHILTGAPSPGRPFTPSRSPLGTDEEAVFQILTGIVGEYGQITCIFANKGPELLKEAYYIPRALKTGANIFGTLIMGSGGTTDALIQYMHGEDPSKINIQIGPESESITLEALLPELLNRNIKLEEIGAAAEAFSMHSLDGAIPDNLPTGVTLDKTGRPAWHSLARQPV
ncbi:Oidioi.mRNA.OKI2018_I69.chr2.g8191.t1.cds [Oikopleura dioica]|uniref:Oidioi.mRNA.OKI2018_I69.chr2.g8191.t1.cds n=1 Tax=Oikopleura dioica TaxID=34765 RepID=A0ABN7TBV9_OIKDI|nr:Oidioi.mRNA.OKI2018_I69.chr2.g8191.t1.cds [Oikopleura dioica]